MVRPSYPGIYVAETPSGVRTISTVPTSVTAFVGYTRKGAVHKAVAVSSLPDFERLYGGLDRNSPLSYAVRQFFLNGGTAALIVRVASGCTSASWVLQDADAAPVFSVTANSPGAWANALRLRVQHDNLRDHASGFHLEVLALQRDGIRWGPLESYRNLNMDPASPQYAMAVINTHSAALQLSLAGDSRQRPAAVDGLQAVSPGVEGSRASAAELAGSAEDKTGIHALLDADLFNLLLIPETFDMTGGEEAGVIAAAIALCKARRAFYIIDAPADRTLVTIGEWAASATQSSHAATYFPAVRIADPLDGSRVRAMAPSGTLAGLYARTDANRGVWKAPAGNEANLIGVMGLTLALNDQQNGLLNPLGVNALRSFPAYGRVAWGSRTLRGSDALADEYKYIPIRRLALFIEESLYRGTQWAVFEANDEPLWAQIRIAVDAFMRGLFGQGAFKGQTPKDGFFVKCDAQTTTQNERNQGIVTFEVGFAPLKPAEFVVMKIQQKTLGWR